MHSHDVLAGPYQTLSLTARLAVALNCAERLCAALHVSHPEITQLIDYLWRFPALSQDDFATWEAARPRLLDAILDDDVLPTEVVRVVDAAGLGRPEFVALLKCCADIIWTSFYTVARDRESLADLGSILETATQNDVPLPDPLTFSGSLFVDRAGWGTPVTLDEVQRWRAHVPQAA